MNAAAFQPFLLSALPLPLVLQFLQNVPNWDSCDLPLTNCSKSDLFLEYFDSYQNQIWIFSLKNSKIVCVAFLILFCSRAECSDLRRHLADAGVGRDELCPGQGSDFQLGPLASPSILSLVQECPGSSGLKHPKESREHHQPLGAAEHLARGLRAFCKV